MLTFAATCLLGCCGFVCSEACDCCGGAPAATAAPAPVATARANTGTQYRTYSYQPSYQPAPIYYQPSSRSYNRQPIGGMHDAGWKIRGGF